jgi:hypothetical protein
MKLVARRDGRVAEGARLESVYTFTGIGGSNPSLSASSSETRQNTGKISNSPQTSLFRFATLENPAIGSIEAYEPNSEAVAQRQRFFRRLGNQARPGQATQESRRPAHARALTPTTNRQYLLKSPPQVLAHNPTWSSLACW